LGRTLLSRHRGFAFLGVLFALALLGVAALTASLLWSVEARREREKELLFAGHEYREALRRYAAAHAAEREPYPRTLEALVRDPAAPEVRRYLRRIYPDPVNRGSDWGLVRAAGGGIVGVYSRSTEAPIRRAGFAREDAAFFSKTRYADWIFSPSPVDAGSAAFAGTGSAAGSPTSGGAGALAGLVASPPAGARPWQADRCANLNMGDVGECRYIREHSGSAAGDACEQAAARRLANCRAGLPMREINLYGPQ